jgi:YVTN family beta-propeller protein
MIPASSPFRHVITWTFLTALAGPGPALAEVVDAMHPDGAAHPLVTLRAQPGPVDRLTAFLAGGSRSVSFVEAGQLPEGDMPRSLAFTPDGTTVLVVNRDTDNVVFFDVVTRIATHVVDVGDFPVDVAVTPDGQSAVVPNVFDNTVSIIDIPTHSVAHTVAITGDQPFRVRITNDGNYAVVGVVTDGATSRFSVIDLAATVPTEILSFPSLPQGAYGVFWTPETGSFGNFFSDFKLTPEGDRIILPEYSGQVAVYSRVDGSVLANLPVVANARGVDINEAGTLAIIGHSGNPGAITKIDLTSLTVANTFSVTESVDGAIIRFTPDSTHAMGAISNNVIFVNLTTGVTTATLYTGVVGDIEISYDGQYAFVSNYNASIIDIASQSIVKQITYAACADAATSPTAYRAVALNNRFRENVHFYNINGLSGGFEGYALSGPIPEGDATYAVDITPDGSVAVAGNLVSENVSIIDLNTDTVRAWVDVGDRVKEVRITPDGNYAVVCAMDANYVQIIDLATDTVVSSLYVYRRPGRVRISPDSQYAYVLNVAGTDQITFIHLDGAASSIMAQVPCGQTGVANGPLYTETSGIELSPDGSLLAVCDSFNDQLRLFDTATFAQVAAAPVGDFPLRCAFSPDGNTVYVNNAFGDSVSVVRDSGFGWGTITTIPGIDWPLTVDVDPSGNFVYVGNLSGTPALRVINTSFNTIVKTLTFANGYARDSYLASDGTLYLAMTSSELLRVDAAGTATAFIDSEPLTAPPADLAFNEAREWAVIAEPVPDGVDIVRYGPQWCLGDSDCSGGAPDFVDILYFVEALTGEAAWVDYHRTHGQLFDPPPCPYALNDLNGGGVEFTDIQAFVNHLGQPCDPF